MYSTVQYLSEKHIEKVKELEKYTGNKKFFLCDIFLKF